MQQQPQQPQQQRRQRPQQQQRRRQPQQKQKQQSQAPKAPRKSNAQLAAEMRQKQAAFFAKLLAAEAAEEEANRGAAEKSGAADADADSSQVDDERDCLICTNPIRQYSFGSCNHCQVCLDDVVKQRVLFGDNACVICKAESGSIVVSPTPPEVRGFETYNLTSLDHVRSTGCYFVDRSAATDVRRLLAKRCPICVRNGETSTVYSVKNLKTHVSKIHGVEFCGVCLDNRRVFCHEQRLYVRRSIAFLCCARVQLATTRLRAFVRSFVRGDPYFFACLPAWRGGVGWGGIRLSCDCCLFSSSLCAVVFFCACWVVRTRMVPAWMG